MRRLLIYARVLSLAAIVEHAQAPTEPRESPKEVVERFWDLNAHGAWLTPDGWDALGKLTNTAAPWSPAKSIYVLKDYRVGDAKKSRGYKGVVGYAVEVDYSEWGEIDPFLNFTRAQVSQRQSSTAGEPAEQRIYEVLYLSDGASNSDSSGHEGRQNAPPRWTIGVPVFGRADVEAALRWVTQMRDQSTDPAMKYNAERTIAILKSLSTGTPVPPRPEGTARKSPSAVGKRFVGLESNLTRQEWHNVAGFFIETPRPQWNNAHIVDIVHTGVAINGDSADVVVSTNSLGELDSSMRLSNYPSMRLPLDSFSASACFGDDRFGFSLLLSNKHWEIAKDGRVKEFEGPLAWRIEDTSFEPLMTLDTAIRYARQVRDKTTDPVVKMNAVRTLTILRHYKEGKPLSDELTAGASGGCG